MINDDLDPVLRDWARGELARTPDTALPDFPAATSRRRPTRLIAIAAAAVFVVAVAAGVSVFADRHHGTTPPAATNGPVPASQLVVHDGDTVTTQGEVLALPGRSVRFCAPVPDFGAGGQDSRFDYCRVGITVTGVDLGKLADRATRPADGAVYGMAKLTGTYRHNTLTVTLQSTPDKPVPESLPSQVPCAAPQGGWPRESTSQDPDLTAVTRYQHAHPGAIVQIAVLRPSDDQVVAYVLTAGNPRPVATALRPSLGKGLCVAKSTWTSTQLARARQILKQLFEPRRPASLYTPTADASDGLGPDAQIQMFLDVPAVNNAVAHKLDHAPLGLIKVYAWLTPQQ